MYLLYLDASGHADFPPPYGRGKDTNYVLAGLAIQHTKWLSAWNGLEVIRRRYFPKIPQALPEVRYGDLINKRGLWATLTDGQRKQVADDIFNLIPTLEPILFAIKVDKIKHFLKYQTSSYGVEPSRQLTVRFMVPRFSKFLQRVGENGVMVYDSETVRIDQPLREFLFKGRLTGVVLQSNPNFDPTAFFRTQNKLDGLIETIFFVESRVSPMIQLADFCAYAVWSHFERKNSNRFNQIYPLFDHVGSTVYGLKEWP
jgi:Protein of unknown function (DUF3800)